MKVLVLTNEDHIDFISKFVFPYNSEHDIHVYYGDDPYLFWDNDYDIGVSFMYLYKVPAEQVNTHTWINFHPAPLPEYKGRNLCYHAIMNGEISWGASVHYMDEDFDTGDIIEVRTKHLYGWETSQDLSDLAMTLSQDLFREYFPRILEGEKLDGTPQSDYHVSGTYYKKAAIQDVLSLPDGSLVGNFVRSVTYGEFYPRLRIGGMLYKIVKDE